MKICILLYDLNNLGGIINHTENLFAGFKKLGHEVDIFKLLWREKISTSHCDVRPEVTYTGIRFDACNGWDFPKEKKLPYKGEENIRLIKKKLSRYDLVVFEIAVPTKQKSNRGNHDWVELYNIPTKKLAVIHDGNLPAYAHILKVAKKLDGVVCVHPCAYHGAKELPVRRKMIFNPFRIPKSDTPKFSSRKDGFLSCQTFKAWKHVHELVGAIRYLPKHMTKYVAGNGIEYRYLTSKNKCKPQYFHKDGQRFWQAALKNDMNYLGTITNKKRDNILKTVKFLVDPSWSNKYAKTGDHFNRVAVEAIINGAVPIVRPLGISKNTKGQGEVFKAGYNCLAIPQSATLKEYAMCLEAFCAFDEKEYTRLQNNGQKLLKQFNRIRVAKQYIEFAFGKDGEVGLPSAKFLGQGEKGMEFFK